MGTDSEPLFPGLVISQYGKGKVAYVPAALDAMYRQTRIRQFADFLSEVIEYVSPERLPYEVDAPATLVANMMSRGDARVLHLINWTGCKFESPQQNVEYIPPVENVEVRCRIPAGRRVRSVRLFVPADWSHRVEQDVLRVTLPRIEKYQGIAIDIE
jgi:hypothetical protein